MRYIRDIPKKKLTVVVAMLERRRDKTSYYLSEAQERPNI
jgi:hypothetical protein